MKSGEEKRTPQDEVENNAPQRVQTTVSPPRVTSQDPDKTSLQEIIPPHSTPNSHRRQQRRVITPQTPHAMVRRIARQQNLSQDMMAETLAQANHCFSISANTKINHPSTPKSEGVILPGMANAVIFPETGKSLKHQVPITKLKYKIQWMRSTANKIHRLYNTNIIRFIRLLIPQVRQARKYRNSPWETIHPPGEIMQYVRDPTWSTRLGVPSHSRPLINTKYQIQVTNYLQTIF
jgi:hypothetical protein